MRPFVLIFVWILFSGFGLHSQNTDCKYKGIELWGDVEIVEYHADIDVYISEYNCSNCFTVEILPHTWKCGDWSIVEYHGKFSIRIVEYSSQADLSIHIKDNPYKTDFMEKYVKK